MFRRQRLLPSPVWSQINDTDQDGSRITSAEQVSYIIKINQLLHAQAPFVAGQLQQNLNQLQQITSDPFILSCVNNCKIEFDYEPSPARNNFTPEYKFSPPEQQTIDNEIDTFLSKSIIERSTSQTGEIISPIFLQPKKEPEKFRVIFNLKNLNDAVTYHKFKMDALESAIKLMKPECFVSSIDLSDAYYSVPIAPEYRKYLKFVWRGALYQFRALPMGLSSSPRIFTEIRKPVFATLRARYGNSCLGYIDDSFYTEDTAVSRREAIKNAVRLFIQLGFVPHPTKSVFQPTQILEFWGFYLNSITMRVTVTETKVANILSICQKFLQRKKFTIRDIASLIKNQNLESHHQYLATRRAWRKIVTCSIRLAIGITNVCEFAQLPQACTDSSCCGTLNLHTSTRKKLF